jgi:amino acid transporter
LEWKYLNISSIIKKSKLAKRGVKKEAEVSDVLVIVLLIAVIIASVVGVFLVYNNVSNTHLESPSVNIVKEQGATQDFGGGGKVVVNVVPEETGGNTG